MSAVPGHRHRAQLIRHALRQLGDSGSVAGRSSRRRATAPSGRRDSQEICELDDVSVARLGLSVLPARNRRHRGRQAIREMCLSPAVLQARSSQLALEFSAGSHRHHGRAKKLCSYSSVSQQRPRAATPRSSSFYSCAPFNAWSPAGSIRHSTYNGGLTARGEKRQDPVDKTSVHAAVLSPGPPRARRVSERLLLGPSHQRAFTARSGDEIASNAIRRARRARVASS